MQHDSHGNKAGVTSTCFNSHHHNANRVEINVDICVACIYDYGNKS